MRAGWGLLINVFTKANKPHRGLRSAEKVINKKCCVVRYDIFPSCKANDDFQMIFPLLYLKTKFSKTKIIAKKPVALYIENLEEHHRKKTFLEEYKDFLNKFEVEYDERYLFKPLE